MKIKTAKFKVHDFSLSPKNKPLLCLISKSKFNAMIHHLEADYFNCIETLSDNSYEVQGPRYTKLLAARPSRILLDLDITLKATNNA